MDETVKDRILLFIKAESLSQNRFEEAVGLSHGYVNNLRSAPTAKILQKIFAAYPKLNKEWLMSGNGDMINPSASSTADIPCISYDAIGGVLSGVDDGGEILSQCGEHYVVPDFAASDFLVRLKGDSMMPNYLPGDLIACRIVLLDRLWFQWGKVYAMSTRQGTLVKKIMPSEREGCVRLVSFNPDYPPFDLETEEIHGVALVEGFIRR